MLHEQIKNALFCYFLFMCSQAPGYSGNDVWSDRHFESSKTLVTCVSEDVSSRASLYPSDSRPAAFVESGFAGACNSNTQDITTSRPNTLSDDADDIQKQLDNEARDKMKVSLPQKIWVIHYTKGPGLCNSTQIIRKSNNKPKSRFKKHIKNRPNHKNFSKAFRKRTCPCHDIECKNNSTDIVCKDIMGKIPMHTKGWVYKSQDKWKLSFPACGGTNQSPVNLPMRGLLHIKASRQMIFSGYNVSPKKLTLVRQGETVSLYAHWDCARPFIYGGAAHSRRYVFHSLAVRQPSEHTVGGLYYPMETQALHVSVEYATLEDALSASDRDKLALLVVANIYKHSTYSHAGLKELIDSISSATLTDTDLKPLPLMIYSPPLKEYAAYHGSLTTPPCSESVLWLVRAKPMPISRELVENLEKNNYGEKGQLRRFVQPLNDRNIYYFD